MAAAKLEWVALSFESQRLRADRARRRERVCYTLSRMDIEWVRQYCLSLPHATEQVQWEDDLVFKVGRKMFAVVPLEPARLWLAFKCTDEEFADLVERPGIIPAPYLARAHWVSLESEDALTRADVRRLLRQAHELVFAKLPKKVQTELSQQKPPKSRRRAKH